MPMVNHKEVISVLNIALQLKDEDGPLTSPAVDLGVLGVLAAVVAEGIMCTGCNTCFVSGTLELGHPDGTSSSARVAANRREAIRNKAQKVLTKFVTFCGT